jgi:hypothetical protein
MCPACIASAATIAVGVTSGGGAVALVLTKVRRVAGFRKLSSVLKTAVSKIKEKQS